MRQNRREDELVLNGGHRLPFQAKGPAQGSGAAFRQSSAIHRNSRFCLDGGLELWEDQSANFDRPGSGRTCGPPLKGGLFRFRAS